MTWETPVFDYTPLLALALLLPVAAVMLLLTWHRRRRARLSRLGTPEMIARLAPAAASRPVGWRAARLATAAALLGVAIAGPRWGVEQQLVRGEGIDIVLALDASVSMLATDVRPNRLERMKQEVRRLRALSGADRVALLAFAGRSYILTPLTVDDGALDLFLDNLDPSVVGQAGSSIARTLRQGTDLLLVTKTGSDRALVVMSDGEAFEPQEDVEAAAKRAAESGISVVTVGFGTAEGSTIPVREGDEIVQKRDESGQVVVSRYHPELLRAAATAAGGTFIDANESDKAGKVRSALSRLRTQSRALEAGRERTPRFQLFVLPALLLLLLDTMLAERRGRRRARGPAAATAPENVAAVLLLCLLPLASGCSGTDRILGEADAAFRAKQFAHAAALYRQAIDAGDRTPQTVYNYGTALVNADSLSQGVEALDRALQTVDRALRERPTDREALEEVQFRALFNQGLAHLRRGLAASGDSAAPELDATLAIYKRALLMRSGHGDAKWNYELALRKQKSGGGGGGGGGGAQDSPAKNESPTSEAPAPQQRPAGGIGRQQAEELLNSAARDERDVQGKRQKQNRAEPPPGGKDW